MSKNTDDQIQEFLSKHGIKDPSCGFYIGNGWLPPVFKALEKMISVGWDKDLHQVKQKFCQLRIYIGNASNEVYEIIRKAEDICNKSCKSCGVLHKLQTPASGAALCLPCKKAEKRMKVYLDDVRPTPHGWVRTYTAPETIALLETGLVTQLSLDHDLGDDPAVGNGYDVVLWLEEQVFCNNFVPPRIIDVHSSNPVGRAKMSAVISRIKQFR